MPEQDPELVSMWDCCNLAGPNDVLALVGHEALIRLQIRRLRGEWGRGLAALRAHGVPEDLLGALDDYHENIMNALAYDGVQVGAALQRTFGVHFLDFELWLAEAVRQAGLHGSDVVLDWPKGRR